jgi:uncharacterized caspase-like protein
MPVQPDHYAVVVGVNHYPSGDLQPLSNALRDAAAFEKWLLDTSTGGGLLPENCRTILSQENSGTPINEDIDQAFEVVLQQVEARPAPHRRLYFYFSGHGMAASLLQTYLCLPKWSNRRRRMALDSEDYWLMLAETGLFQEMVCLFDCCRSYKPGIGGLPSTLGQARPDRNAFQSRLFIAFAAEFLQSAYEHPEFDGHGFFTQALLSGLRGGACQPAGGAPAQRLKSFLESETVHLAKLAKKIQTPTVFNGFPATDEPVFGSAPPTAAGQLVYVVTIRPADHRSIVLVHPDDSETPWDGTNPWRIEVGEGLHILEDKSSGTYQRLPRAVTEGEFHVEF